MIPLTLGTEVREALEAGRPVVALESTIITHGLPAPQNLDVAREIEAAVRAAGAVPATIALMGGQVRVGLTAAELERLATAAGVAKVSRADLAHHLAAGGLGATTVAATMIAAHLAGIAVFATGGIGGVHRGAGETFDISADLDELARTPVTVVSAGVKAILDLPKTLEALETRGVPVIGWRTDAFPAFWSRASGLRCPLRADEAGAIAQAHLFRAAMGLGGQLVANRVPTEAEIPRAEIEPVIARAVAEAEAAGIAGKDVTPFLLDRVYRATEGRSLEANIALVLSNARLAARISRELASMPRHEDYRGN